MADAERVFYDTNVLLSAVDVKRAFHAQALHVLPNDGTELCLAGRSSESSSRSALARST